VRASRFVASAEEAFRRRGRRRARAHGPGVADVLSIVEAGLAPRRRRHLGPARISRTPISRPPELARQSSTRGRARAGITVLGTASTPAFVMDRLAAHARRRPAVRVDAVRVERVVDAAKRRGPLRAKVGRRSHRREFGGGVAAGRLGQPRPPGVRARIVGLGLGISFDEVKNRSAPVVTSEASHAPASRRAAWPACASRPSLRGGREVVRLDLRCRWRRPTRTIASSSRAIRRSTSSFRGGTHGDRGTVGTTVSAIPASSWPRPASRRSSIFRFVG